MKDIPLFSGKLSDKAVLNPSDYIGHKKELMGIGNFKMPKCCILCFFKSFYKTIEESYKPKIVVFNEDYPIYIFDYNGVDIAFVYPTIGSSAGTVLDEMIALGAKYFIFI
ncbi:MAG TPA: hypothetical protein VJI12_03985, partial [archaeon]|nr:hypothetical protein [archaeon]